MTATITRPTSKVLGPALVLGSAVLFSFSGILTKSISAGSWTILSWRGVIGGFGIAAYVWFTGGNRSRRQGFGGEMFRLGRRGWLMAAIGATGSVAFITSFKNTYVANVSVIYATVPFIAALFERLILGEPVRVRTLKTAAVSMIGVVIIVAGSFGTPSLVGDSAALAMVMFMALFMVLVRAFPDTDAVLASAGSGLLLFVVGWVVSDPLDVSSDDALLLVAFGLLFAGATVLLIEGTRRISAAEAGLLGSAETPMAIALAWVLLSEVPPAASIVGSLIVLVAVLVHTYRESGVD